MEGGACASCSDWRSFTHSDPTRCSLTPRRLPQWMALTTDRSDSATSSAWPPRMVRERTGPVPRLAVPSRRVAGRVSEPSGEGWPPWQSASPYRCSRRRRAVGSPTRSSRARRTPHSLRRGLRRGAAQGRDLLGSELGPEGPRGDPQTALEREYHLSYPFVFEWEDDVYLIPESTASKRVELYRAESFPDRWSLAGVLLERRGGRRRDAPAPRRPLLALRRNRARGDERVARRGLSLLVRDARLGLVTHIPGTRSSPTFAPGGPRAGSSATTAPGSGLRRTARAGTATRPSSTGSRS